MNVMDVNGCKIAYRHAGIGGQVLVFLHGNSMSSEIFEAQFNGVLAEKYCLLAFDLPGHGKSDNATDPEATYTLPGYASVIRSALEQLQVNSPVMIGFSLGGNVALEMLADGQDMAGLMIIGAGPLSGDPAHLMDGFLPDIDLSNYADQVTLVSVNPMPLAIVFGANDELMNTDHIGLLDYANLWGGAVRFLDGGNHSPFWDVAPNFDSLLDAFVEQVCELS